MNKLFVMGAYNAFTTEDEGVFAIEGKAQGEVKVGDELIVSDLGSDKEIKVKVKVKEIAIRRGDKLDPLQSAKNTDIIVFFISDEDIRVKRGQVMHSEEVPYTELRNAYLNLMGNIYVVARKMELTDEEYAALSLSDCVDLWNCFMKFQGKKYEKNDKKTDENTEKLEKLYNAIRKKLLASDNINIVYSKLTGEPFMFNRFVKEGPSYSCTFPNIMLITDSRLELLKSKYADERFEIKKIEKERLLTVLGNCFYENGAVGVEINASDVFIDGESLAKKKENPNNEIGLLANPDFTRWLLLLEQISSDDFANPKMAYAIIESQFEQELLKATFLVPAIKEGDTCKVAVAKGKSEGKNAACAYTDWTKLRNVYDTKWGAITSDIAGIIEDYDIVINPAKGIGKTVCLSKEDYEAVKKRLNG